MHKTFLYLEHREQIIEDVVRVFAPDNIQVLPAHSVREALERVDDSWFHAAVLDVRVENDSDVDDFSGLYLARDPRFRRIPVIIFTGFKTPELVDKLLEGYPNIVGRVLKKDCWELRDTVRRVFDTRVKINWDLELDWGTLAPDILVRHIDPRLPLTSLAGRAQELEDLLRRLWLDPTHVAHVRIERMLWHRPQCAALVAHTFHAGTTPRSFMLVLGERDTILRQAARVKEFAPRTCRTILHRTAETAHFAVNLFELEGLDLQRARPFAQIYPFARQPHVQNILKDLLAETTKWDDGSAPISGNTPLVRSACAWLGIPPVDELQPVLDAQLAELGARLPQLKLRGTIQVTPTQLALRPSEQGASLIFPIPRLSSLELPGETLRQVRIPGRLTADNVLVDAKGQTWLTDFEFAGYAPEGWVPANLDALVRFDGLEDMVQKGTYPELDVQMVSDFEQRAVTLDRQRAGKSKLSGDMYRAELTLRALWQQLAPPVPQVQGKRLPWLIVQTLQRMVTLPPVRELTLDEVGQLLHLWLTLALAQQFLPVADPLTNETPSGLHLNEATREFTINGQPLEVSGNHHAILVYLYNHDDGYSTSHDIFTGAWSRVRPELASADHRSGTDAELIEGDRINLFKHMTTLRQLIGRADPHTTYIETRRGHGYRLIKNPYAG